MAFWGTPLGGGGSLIDTHFKWLVINLYLFNVASDGKPFSKVTIDPSFGVDKDKILSKIAKVFHKTEQL